MIMQQIKPNLLPGIRKHPGLKTLLLAACLSVLPTGVFATPGGGYNGYHMFSGGWGWAGMIFGPLMMVVMFGIVIAIVVLIIRWIGSGTQSGLTGGNHAENSALDTLKDRFARGEIDADEYRERCRVLKE
jgi:putative membrane protein